MSLAACADRWARLRTSVATTAKPRPASPARAASTAALSAKRLVCRAISSMTPMISAILRELSSIRAIASTACATTVPPRSATSRVSAANELACWALSAFRVTVLASSCIELEISSRFAACSSVRWERSAVLPDRYLSGGVRNLLGRKGYGGDRVMQPADGRIEIVPDLLVGLRKSVRQAEGQIAAGDGLEALRKQPDNVALLLRKLGLGLDIPAALVLDFRAQHGKLLGAIALLGLVHLPQRRLRLVERFQQASELVPALGRDDSRKIAAGDLFRDRHGVPDRPRE